MATEPTAVKNVSAPAVATVAAGAQVSVATYQSMLNVLNELVSHTHIFYDDYSTACNCNCNCNCSRGIL